MNEKPKHKELFVYNHLLELLENESVLGIVLTGSYGRGMSDEFSDLDYVVFVNKRNDIKNGKFYIKNLTMDARVEFFDEFKEGMWSDDMYFAYLNSRVLFDKYNNIKSLFEQKSREWESDISRRVSLNLVNLSVLVAFPDNWRGLKSDTHYDKYIGRNDDIGAYRVLNKAYEIILETVYLLNHGTIPDFKNKSRLITNLRWCPDKLLNDESHEALLHTTDLSEESFKNRYEAITNVVIDIKNYVDKNFELSDDLYNYYLLNR